MAHQYLYLTIKREAQTDQYAALVLNEIDRYTRMNADLKFERHEATTKALEFTLNELDTQHHTVGRIQSPGMVRAYINKYLGRAHIDDLPGLKLK
jgi:hypothetical protein